MKMNDTIRKIKAKSQHMKFLYDHGTDKDYPEYERTRNELIQLIKQIEAERGAKKFSIRSRK